MLINEDMNGWMNGMVYYSGDPFVVSQFSISVQTAAHLAATNFSHCSYYCKSMLGEGYTPVFRLSTNHRHIIILPYS